MALTQGARGKIKSFVQDAKRLLTGEFEGQLQQHYGIRMDGSCLMVEELTTKDASIIQTARLLRERLSYLEDTIAGNDKKREAVQQLVREQAFTILNRFAALRMAEERNIIRETIRKAYKSEGFEVFDQLTGGAKTAEQFIRYTWYINAVFDELANDLPSVFDRYSPFALLYPSERTFHLLLSIINQEELQIFREEGQQPINLWKDDETIGWIYQYYNSREEISAMRDASGVPRNSRELAVRNQFFTPRYVVQFLVDNSLGRQWYEMTKGNTILKSFCQYMVKRSVEVFLHKGELPPINKEENTNYIEYRAIKDPREILMLDPACGSMHFGLYSFDLYEQIYLEAWDNYPTLMQDLRDQYLRKDFIKQIPGMILRHNLHGVDIDPRAIQIAGLSLWLRAQKSYDNLGLQPAERPAINKSNLVVAEPMPGNVQMLSDFAKSLPGPIGKLVKVIWDKMKLAGETGLLLKIEEELKKEIEISKKEWEKYKNTSTQTTLFDSPEASKTAHLTAIYGKEQKITKDFFDTAEEQVLQALENFAVNADGANSFQKILFAEDTARGFSFIELCRKRYDVILMNPPFGSGSISTEKYYKINYPSWGLNILCCFFPRMNELLKKNGQLSSIFDRTVTVKSSYEKFRIEEFIGKINSVIDTGWGVLDANVETSVYVLNKKKDNVDGVFFDLREERDKANSLLSAIYNYDFKSINSNHFSKLPNSVIGYYFDETILSLFESNKNIRQLGIQARDGHNLDSFEHFRLFWEVNSNAGRFEMMYNGGPYTSFYYPYRDMCLYGKDGYLIRNHRKTNFRNPTYQLKKGVGYGKRGEVLDAHILKSQTVFTKEGQAISNIGEKDALSLLSFLNSSLAQYLLSLYAGQHKASGYINLLPLPALIGFENVIEIIELKRDSYSIDETCIETKLLIAHFIGGSIKKSFNIFIEKIKSHNYQYEEIINKNDEFWLWTGNLSGEALSQINEFKKKRPVESLYSIENINLYSHEYKNQIGKELIQNLFGFIFLRWDIDYYNGKKKIPEHKNVFDKLPRVPQIAIPNQFDRKTEENNPTIEFYSNDSLGNNSVFHKLRELINIIWNSQGIIINELEEFIGISDIENFINDPLGFFNFHLSRYTKSRREAPIYWPLSTKSNLYTIWVYYPRLNENSFYKMVNELVDPKIKEISDEVSVLEINGTSKDLNDTKLLRDELEDFKKELLRVAQLPFKPNHDDGVLITAAPLHNLFRHAKWRKSTEDCWNSLERGEYDWSHMAYNIWPERVRKKCKKDLSMAIAHGLEDICEVKPKEKTEKKKPEIKVEQQKKLI